MWRGVPSLTIRRSVVSSLSGVRGGSPVENGFYAYFRSDRSHLVPGTPFSVFLSDGALSPTSRGPGNFSKTVCDTEKVTVDY